MNSNMTDDANKEPETQEELEAKATKSGLKRTKAESEKEPDPAGLDPTRYGDWEKNGRCIEF